MFIYTIDENNSIEEIAIYVEIYIITITVYVMYFLIEFCSIANTNSFDDEKKKKSIDIWLEFSSILIYLVVSTQSFIHSRLNRKHDISLIEHRKEKKKKKIGTFLLLSLLLIQLQEQYPSCLDPFFTLFLSLSLSLSLYIYISLFFPCLSGVKRLVVLLLLCRISRTLSFLVYV